jgi:argininosuccinate synthase
VTVKVVLAYSGGLDTSVAIPWIMEKYKTDVVTLTVDLGGRDISGVQERALKAGATQAVVVDARETFVKEYVFPALKAGAIYEGEYPLATALGRPLIAKLLVGVARDEGAYAIAHGCTGKGNDQVRFDIGTTALAPDLKVIAPAREWNMSREDEVSYAHQHGIPLVSTVASPYSTDENIWGRSIEAGDLEDPWREPPEEAYAWTVSVDNTPSQPHFVEIAFKEGIPTAVDGEPMDAVSLIQELNRLAGERGIGRIDHMENRLVGIKSREVYEAPAAVVLHKAHSALEAIALGKPQARLKNRIAQEYAELVYNGLWFTRHRQDLDAYVTSTQRFVTGSVRMKLHKGTATVVGRKSPNSLYEHGLATYSSADQFDHKASEGFISIFGLPVRTQARLQPLKHGEQ